MGYANFVWMKPQVFLLNSLKQLTVCNVAEFIGLCYITAQNKQGQWTYSLLYHRHWNHQTHLNLNYAKEFHHALEYKTHIENICNLCTIDLTSK
jgi:hypothetical protein